MQTVEHVGGGEELLATFIALPVSSAGTNQVNVRFGAETRTSETVSVQSRPAASIQVAAAASDVWFHKPSLTVSVQVRDALFNVRTATAVIRVTAVPSSHLQSLSAVSVTATCQANAVDGTCTVTLGATAHCGSTRQPGSSMESNGTNQEQEKAEPRAPFFALCWHLRGADSCKMSSVGDRGS